MILPWHLLLRAKDDTEGVFRVVLKEKEGK